MPSLTVWRYDTPLGADSGGVRLKDLEQRGALRVHDAITVTWLKEEKQPRIGHLRHATSGAAGKGTLLGGLIGLVVLAPVAGAAAGAAIGAAAHRLRGTGIDRTLLQEVKDALKPGTSALVVLASDADLDAIRPFLDRHDSVLIHAELSADAPEVLASAIKRAGKGKPAARKR
jgi:uncharacterized membrane protein